MTLANQGALVSADGAVSTISAPRVEVVDTTGAGDALAGVYLASRLEGRTPERALARSGRREPVLPRLRVRALIPGRREHRLAPRRCVVTVLEELVRQRIVPVLRCADADDAVATGRALAAAGVRALELTMSTPGVLAAVPPLAADGLIVGMGTIRSAGEVEAAVAAGARFAVSFWNPPGFVAAATAAGVPAIPGGLTPGEIAAAQLERPAAVKVFPATLVSPDYVRTLLALDPSLRLLVTGGIAPTAAAIGPWLEAGAVMVGVGGALGTVSNAGAAEVERRARAALDALF